MRLALCLIPLGNRIVEIEQVRQGVDGAQLVQGAQAAHYGGEQEPVDYGVGGKTSCVMFGNS